MEDLLDEDSIAEITAFVADLGIDLSKFGIDL
jgi:hypothetical protein